MYKLSALLLVLSFGIAGCSHSPTVGEKMVNQGETSKKLGKEWSEGEVEVKEGKRLIKKGETQIHKGEHLIEKGNRKEHRSEKFYTDNMIEVPEKD